MRSLARWPRSQRSSSSTNHSPPRTSRLAERRAERSRIAISDFEGVALIVTHDPIEALTLAGRVVVLEAGRVVQQGDAEAFRRRPGLGVGSRPGRRNLLRGRIAATDGDIVLETEGFRLSVLLRDLLRARKWPQSSRPARSRWRSIRPAARRGT